jgi:hypothetical protein
LQLQNETVASILLERLIALDPELGKQIDGNLGRPAFIKLTHRNSGGRARESRRTVEGVCHGAGESRAHDGDVTAFVGTLQRERWLLGEAYVEFQVGLIERQR